MHDRHLEGFVRVVECGSFSKAAEELFVSPNALIKQINILERDLGVELFDRTNRGITPTPAGEFLFEKAKAFIAESHRIMEEARNLGSNQTHVIRLAASLLRPTRKIASWWKAVEIEHPRLKLIVVPIPDDNTQWQKYFYELGSEIDVAVAIKPGSAWGWSKKCKVKDIYQSPAFCAVPQGHRLSGKMQISLTDLHGEKLLLGPAGVTPSSDRLREHIAAEHPSIHVVDCAPYDLGALNRAAEDGSIVLVCGEWAEAHPSFDYIPLEGGWDATISLVYPIDCNAAVLEFVEAISTQAAADSLAQA